jgi:hypothetical protein
LPVVRRTLHTRPERLIGPDEDCCWKDGEAPCAEGSWTASKYPRLDWLLDIIVGELGWFFTWLRGLRSQTGSFSLRQPPFFGLFGQSAPLYIGVRRHEYDERPCRRRARKCVTIEQSLTVMVGPAAGSKPQLCGVWKGRSCGLIPRRFGARGFEGAQGGRESAKSSRRKEARDEVGEEKCQLSSRHRWIGTKKKGGLKSLFPDRLGGGYDRARSIHVWATSPKK